MAKSWSLARKALLSVAALILLLTIVLIGGVSWVYNHPATAWQIVETRFLPTDLKVTWNKIHLNVEHVQGWNFEIHFSLDQLNVRKDSPFVDVQIDRLVLNSNATFFFPKTAIQLKELTIRSASPLIIKTKPSDASKEPFDPRQTLQQIKSILSKAATWQNRIAIGLIDIELADIQYSSGETAPLTSSVAIQNKAENGRRIDFLIGLQGLSKAIDQINLQGSGDLSRFGEDASFLDAKLMLDGKSIKSDFPVQITFYKEQLSVTSNFKFSYLLKNKWLTVHPTLNLSVTPSQLELKLFGDIQGIPGPISTIKDVRINYQLPLTQEWLKEKGHLSLTAPVPLFFLNEKLRRNVIASCRCKIASSLNIKLEADLWLDRLLAPSQEIRPAISADLRAETVSNSIFALDLGATLKMMNTETGWRFEPTLDTTAQIKNFKAAREILKTFKIMVPAPLSVLDGTIQFHAKSPVEFKTVIGKPSPISAKAQLVIDLKSSNQMVKAKTQLLMTSNSDFKAMNIDVDALIDDLVVELPPLDPVKGLPKLVLDSRIQMKPKEPQKKASSFKLTFGFRLKTTKPAAIKLLYPLADPYIPISIDYGRGTNGEGGYVQIEPFAINYLKRTVHVDSLRLNLDETAGADFPIDGKFHIQQTEYKVFIRVGGTTKQPSTDFSSEPYLERADIISVLLFDRTSDRLVGGDSETAGNAQAAVADKAIGLFGLWAFAATPIRSFSYNAVTKVYSATIVLGDGLTAGVGTSLDEYTSFEIRKRLSKNWVIATSWGPSDSSDETRKVVLQWERRY